MNKENVLKIIEILLCLPYWAWIIIGVILVLFILLYFGSKRELIQSDKNIKLTKPKLPKFANSRDVLRQAKKATVSIITEDNEYGSGVLVSEYGFIITNYYLIEFVGAIQVKLYDGRSFTAKIVHMDDEHDLALLKIKSTNLIALPKAETWTYETGDTVFAIGASSDTDLQNSVMRGVVSAIRKLDGCITLDTDAKITSENSGGPLINSKGEIVGINASVVEGEQSSTHSISSSIDINHAFERLKLRY